MLFHWNMCVRSVMIVNYLITFNDFWELRFWGGGHRELLRVSYPLCHKCRLLRREHSEKLWLLTQCLRLLVFPGRSERVQLVIQSRYIVLLIRAESMFRWWGAYLLPRWPCAEWNHIKVILSIEIVDSNWFERGIVWIVYFLSIPWELIVLERWVHVALFDSVN
jgi:hypothetical protein